MFKYIKKLVDKAVEQRMEITRAALQLWMTERLAQAQAFAKSDKGFLDEIPASFVLGPNERKSCEINSLFAERFSPKMVKILVHNKAGDPCFVYIGMVTISGAYMTFSDRSTIAEEKKGREIRRATYRMHSDNWKEYRAVKWSDFSHVPNVLIFELLNPFDFEVVVDISILGNVPKAEYFGRKLIGVPGGF